MNLNGKGKAIPVEVWTDPEVSSRLKLPECETIDTCKCLGFQPYAPAAFTSQEIFLILFSLRGLFNRRVTERPQTPAPPRAPFQEPTSFVRTGDIHTDLFFF